MTSSMNTGDRRWGASRRSGMTVLGKVAVPKPINLPSQRLENHGQNRDVEIVPKGTLSWGTKSSNSTSNAWGSSSTITTAESGLSPSHASARPSSGGSVTRPSTAGSEVTHDNSNNAWGPNTRPSSASAPMTSNHNSNISLRPQSAETTHGTSQRSRFADTAPDNTSAWGSGPTDKWDTASSKDGKFSLTSGDFPTLGLEKEPSGRNSRDGSSHGRPNSSSGEVSEKKAPICDSMGDMQCYPGPNNRNGNSWRREGAFCDDSRPGMEKWHNDPHSFPIPQHYETWPNPPVNNPNGMWYRGPPNGPPFRPPVGPNGYPMDPFPLYRPQMNPREMHPGMGEMYRPHMHDAYPMPVRPGYYPPCDPYYGPPPMGPMGSQNRFPSPNLHDSRNMVSGFNSDHNAPLINKPQDGHRMVLLKQGDLLDAHFSRGATPMEVNDVKKSEDPQFPNEVNLIQKIEGLNAKLRSDHENKQEPSNLSAADPVDSSHDKERKPRQNAYRGRHHGKGKLERTENVAALEPIDESLKEAGESSLVYPEKDTDADADSKQNQRASMLELAKIRLKQREREEEERSRDQKAKALARLEELNRRTQVEGSSLLGPKPTPKPDGEAPRSVVKDPVLLSKKTGPTGDATKQKGPQPLKVPQANSSVTGNPTVYFGGVPVEITPSVLNVKSRVACEEKPPANSPVESKRSKTPEYDLDPASLQPPPEPKVADPPTEETNSKSVKQMKPHSKKVQRNSHPNRTEKLSANESVVWAPVRPPPPPTPEVAESKPPVERHNNPRGKRAEIERYVPKQANNNAQERDEVLPATSAKNGKTYGAWRKRVNSDAVEPRVPDQPVEDGNSSKDQNQTVGSKGKRQPPRMQKPADSPNADSNQTEGTKAHWQPKGTSQKTARAVEPESDKKPAVQKGPLKSNTNYEYNAKEVPHKKGNNFGRRGRQVTNVDSLD